MSLILSGTDGLSDVDGTAATPAIRGTDANTGIFFPAADTIAFSEGGVEAMRIDSDGDVGIGTSSPAAKLHIFSANSVSSRVETSGAGSAASQFKSPSGSTFLGQDATGGYLLTDYSAPLLFYINNTERARIDTSGNFKLTGSTAEIQMAVGAERTISASGSSSATVLTFKRWNGSSYVSDITMDGSGNLLVGTTSSSLSAANRGVIEVNGTTDTALGFKSSNSLKGFIYASATEFRLDASAIPITFDISSSEKARIDTSGNLLVGTTSSSSGFTLQRSGSDTAEIKINQTGTGGRDYRIGSTGSGYGSAGNLIFYDATASAERARIDSSGNLLVGTTTALGLVTVARSTASSYNYASNAISNQPDHMGFFNGGTNTGSIQRNGGSGVSYVTTSDYRLKENIVPMTGALTKVTKLKPVTYIWKLDGSEGQGFIAHELAEVVPDCVAGDKDAVNEDGSIKPQGIDTSFLVATLTAAIQEQQALITQLTARLDAANL